MNKYNFVSMPTKEQLALIKLNALYRNEKNAGKQLHSFGMNYNFDKNGTSTKFKLLTPEQNIAHERLESSRKTNTHLDNQMKAITAYVTLLYGAILLTSAIIDNIKTD